MDMDRFFFISVLCFLIFGEILGTPLPECKQEIPHEYLLQKEEVLGCGLPLSRSYLYSKFNAALAAESMPYLNNLGKEVSVKITACAIPSSAEKRLWKDNISVVTPTPWTLESCQETEVNFWGRIASNISFHHVRFRTKHSASSCAWEALFTPVLPGDYSLELKNLWIRGSTYSHIDACQEKKNIAWDGAVRFIPDRLAMRGSAHIPCGDFCSIFEQCYYYTAGEGAQKCMLYTNESTPKQVKGDKKTSGVRKPELPAVHVGAISGNFNGGYNRNEDGVKCHDQTHILNSPQSFTVKANNKNIESSLKKGKYYNYLYAAEDGFSGKDDVFCSRGDLPGHWVKWDTSRCPTSRSEEMQIMLSQSTPVPSESFGMGGNVSIRYHAPTDSVIYGNTESESEYHLVLPQQTSPPWQLYPRCGVGYKAIPPDSIEYITSKSGELSPKKMTELTYTTRKKVLEGMVWTPSSGECTYRHFSRGQIRRCFTEKKINSMILSGDSIIGGFSTMLKWMVGVQGGLTENWYQPREKGQERAISTSSVSLEKSAATLSMGGVRCVMWDDINCLKSLVNRASRNPSVFIYNFNIEHVMWGRSAEEFEFHTKRFFEGFRKQKAANKIKPGNVFIFLNAMATLGFREPYCTNARAEKFSDIIQEEARKSDWLVLDGFNMTMLRPDMSRDGMHFGDEMNMMMVQVLMGMLCEGESH